MSGLMVKDSERSLVLRSSSLFANTNGFVASTLARLCYFNQFDDEAEAVFVYNDNATFITDFRATIGQRKVHREIRELLSEKEAESCSVQDQTDLIISIGKIPPNALVLLEVDVLGELETTDNGQALVFKTPEIFTPFHDERSEACSTRQDYKFDLKIRSDMPCQLAGCHSTSHAIQVDADANATNAETVIITLAEEFKYDRQINVHFYPAKPLDVYTCIEPGIGTTQEINDSPKNARYSVVNVDTRTITDPQHKTIEHEESSLQNEIVKPKVNEQKDVLKSDNVTHPSKNCSSNINENIIHEGSSFVSDSCLNEHSICSHDYRNNKEKATSCLKKDSKYFFTNRTNEMNEKYISCIKEDPNRYQLDRILKNATSVKLDENLQDIKPHENYTIQMFLCRNSTSKKESDHSLNKATAKDSASKAHKNSLLLKKSSSVNRCAVENNNLKSRNHTRHFLSDSIIAVSFLPDLSNYSVCGEYIFMLDRSGSMNGSHICNAKESLVLFLKSLPTSSYFNVVSFGSYSRSLFPCSQRYTQDSLEKACSYVNSIKADMGGSELLQPLKAVLEKPHKVGYMRNVFVLTDGDIAQPDAILKYLKRKRHKARIFTFGIGPKISHNTVRDIARSAQGKAYFTEPGSKVQTKVIECLKEVLKPTLCEVKVDWQLPTNWQLLRATSEIPFSIADQRINLYASVQLPSRAQSRKISSSVKEFWFDEELDSCQLGDNMFFEDVQDNEEFPEYWGTDTSTSDGEQQNDEKVASIRECDVGNDRNDIVANLATKEMKDDEESGDMFEKTTADQSNVQDIVKNWREMRNTRVYSSDTSTETEDECQEDCSENHWNINYKNSLHIDSSMSQSERNGSKKYYDLNQQHDYLNSITTYSGMETSDVINNLDHVINMSTDDSRNMMDKNINLSTTKTCISPLDASDVMCNDVIHDVIYNHDVIHDAVDNDVINNDVNSVYITDYGNQGDCIRQNDGYTKSCNVLRNDTNHTASSGNKKNRENVIDCDIAENIPSCNYNIDSDVNVSPELTKDKKDSDWGSVFISGHIGPNIHRERIPFCLSRSTSKGILLHQMAAKKLIDDLEAILDSTSDSSRVEREIVTLSKESRVPSSMTSSMTINDTGNLIGVSQNSLGLTLRRRKEEQRINSPQLTRGENRPAILVSCPSVDNESPEKRRVAMSSEEAISDDGKYYRIERLDPEGCDQVKRETRRKRLVDCRSIPVTAIHRRKIVSTRLTLLTRKMKNAHKLNVFAGPPYIRLILLQYAEGFWQLTYAFARIIGLPLVQLELAAPFVDSTMIPLAEQDDRLGIDCYYDSLALWATALALVYLKRKWTSHEKDWELIAIKAEAWLQKQTFPQGFGYIDVMLAAKQAIVLLEQKYRSRAKSEPVGLIE